MNIQTELNPTLWRTCRMLAGVMRIKLLRQLFLQSGRSVSEMARVVKVSVPDASQELRKIQSRGFLRADRRGANVCYCLHPDPQVASAEPLLKAVVEALENGSKNRDAEIVRIAKGLAHPRRIALVRALLRHPHQASDLPRFLGITATSIRVHTNCLVQTGWVQWQGDWVMLVPQSHPLAVALLSLVVKPGTR